MQAPFPRNLDGTGLQLLRNIESHNGAALSTFASSCHRSSPQNPTPSCPNTTWSGALEDIRHTSWALSTPTSSLGNRVQSLLRLLHLVKEGTRGTLEVLHLSQSSPLTFNVSFSGFFPFRRSSTFSSISSKPPHTASEATFATI